MGKEIENLSKDMKIIKKNYGDIQNLKNPTSKI